MDFIIHQFSEFIEISNFTRARRTVSRDHVYTNWKLLGISTRFLDPRTYHSNSKTICYYSLSMRDCARVRGVHVGLIKDGVDKRTASLSSPIWRNQELQRLSR